ncbi:MAG: PEP-CTERM sorting domain-containing protein [Burkholderiales bacterium]|nr:PEP-CTERM sorting domain-containing protein [Burkholderiales bacterium]
MKRLIGILLLAASPLAANANIQVNSLVSCSGDLSISALDDQPSVVGCTGSLSFTGASLTSSTPLEIWSTNDLSFFNVFVSAPTLNFSAGGTILLDAQSLLVSPNIALSANNSIVLNGTIAQAVPEPSSAILAAFGLIGAAIAGRKKSHSVKMRGNA